MSPENSFLSIHVIFHEITVLFERDWFPFLFCFLSISIISIQVLILNDNYIDLICRHAGAENDGLFYSCQDLEYIYFVHSLCLLGRVLLYSGGRALFPVLLPDTEGNQDFVV